MNELVFLESTRIDSEMFTTSDVIAQYAGISHHAVQQQISKYYDSLTSFGTVAFEMRARTHITGATLEKIYFLNEQQATLLFTYFKNTETVIRFKTELVKQFFAMRLELTRRQVLREVMKPIRRGFTDAIKEVGHSVWDYKLYTDLAYKVATGMSAAQLRKERGAKKKDKAIDYMTAGEIEAVTKIQDKIAVLLDLGMVYEQVKGLLMNKRTLLKTA